MRKLVLAAVLAGSLCLPGRSQAADGPPDAALPPLAAASFERLVRFEIIAVGSFPLALFYVNVGYDLAAFFRNGMDPLYAPWPFKNKAAPVPEATERGARIAVAIGVSALVALLDTIFELPTRVRTPLPEPPPAGNGAGQAAGDSSRESSKEAELDSAEAPH